MINLNAIKVMVDFEKYSYRKINRRDDGLIEVFDFSNLKLIIIEEKGFYVKFHMDDIKDEKDIPWDILHEFQKYFNNTNIELLNILCQTSKRFDFEFDFFNIEADPVSSEEYEKTGKYYKWPYLQFDFRLNQIFSIEEFREQLNKIYNTYQVYDRDWPEIKIFFKKFTEANISKTFKMVKELIEINNEIVEDMELAKRILFTASKKGWFELLKEI